MPSEDSVRHDDCCGSRTVWSSFVQSVQVLVSGGGGARQRASWWHCGCLGADLSGRRLPPFCVHNPFTDQMAMAPVRHWWFLWQFQMDGWFEAPPTIRITLCGRKY